MDKKLYLGDIKGIDDKEMTLTCSISTNTRDRQGEVIEPKGIDLKNYQKNPVVLWAHDYSMPPIGKAMWVRKDGDSVISKVKFANTEFAQEIFQMFKEGFLKAFSIGFMPKEWVNGDGQKEPYRTYTKVELLEYSAVPVPANPDAIALAMSKGVLKNAALIKAFEAHDEKKDDVIVHEFDLEKKESIKGSAENIEIKDVKVHDGLSEMLAEIKSLQDKEQDLQKQVDTLKGENANLRFKLYEAKLEYDKKLSEMAVEPDLDEIFVRVVNRAVRKAQGKLD